MTAGTSDERDPEGHDGPSGSQSWYTQEQLTQLRRLAKDHTLVEAASTTGLTDHQVRSLNEKFRLGFKSSGQVTKNRVYMYARQSLTLEEISHKLNLNPKYLRALARKMGLVVRQVWVIEVPDD